MLDVRSPTPTKEWPPEPPFQCTPFLFGASRPNHNLKTLVKTASDSLRARTSPALYSPQAGVFCRPAAHGVVGGLEAIVDGLIRDLRQLLKGVRVSCLGPLPRFEKKKGRAEGAQMIYFGWSTYIP